MAISGLASPPTADLTRGTAYISTFNALERDLGGRDAIISLLAHAASTRVSRYLLTLLTSEEQGSQSLGVCCALAEITPGEFYAILRQGQTLAIEIRAMQVAVTEAPKVVAHLFRQAQPHYEACDACDEMLTAPDGTRKGNGKYTTYRPDGTSRTGMCAACKGDGTILHQPKLARQKLAIDVARLLPKGPGVVVGIQMPGGGSGKKAFNPADLQAESEIIDAEPDVLPLQPPADDPEKSDE